MAKSTTPQMRLTKREGRLPLLFVDWIFGWHSDNGRSGKVESDELEILISWLHEEKDNLLVGRVIR